MISNKPMGSYLLRLSTGHIPDKTGNELTEGEINGTYARFISFESLLSI
jgi:hypothetical protein